MLKEYGNSVGFVITQTHTHMIVSHSAIPVFNCLERI